MNSNEIMPFYEEKTSTDPDWYIAVDKISGFSKFDDNSVMVYVFGIEKPFKAYGKIRGIVEVYDMKIRNLMYDV